MSMPTSFFPPLTAPRPPLVADLDQLLPLAQGYVPAPVPPPPEPEADAAGDNWLRPYSPYSVGVPDPRAPMVQRKEPRMRRQRLARLEQRLAREAALPPKPEAEPHQPRCTVKNRQLVRHQNRIEARDDVPERSKIRARQAAGRRNRAEARAAARAKDITPVEAAPAQAQAKAQPQRVLDPRAAETLARLERKSGHLPKEATPARRRRR